MGQLNKQHAILGAQLIMSLPSERERRAALDKLRDADMRLYQQIKDVLEDLRRKGSGNPPPK